LGQDFSPYLHDRASYNEQYNYWSLLEPLKLFFQVPNGISRAKLKIEGPCSMKYSVVFPARHPNKNEGQGASQDTDSHSDSHGRQVVWNKAYMGENYLLHLTNCTFKLVLYNVLRKSSGVPISESEQKHFWAPLYQRKWGEWKQKWWFFF